MRFDSLIDEMSLIDVQRLAKICGPYSAAAKAIEWAFNAKEKCYFFRSRSGVLVAVRESVLQGVGPLKNVELESHFTAADDEQYVRCLHCGKTRIRNQGLAKLSHLARCTGSGARRNSSSQPASPEKKP